jgi:enolase
MKIKKIWAQEILDSRATPTVKGFVELEDGTIGVSAVPSGASTGIHEAVELRDNDEKRFGGQGVLKAVESVNGEISSNLIGLDAEDQKNIDYILIDLDGTENKSRLGANAILSVSLAVAQAQALSEKKELFEYLTKFNPDFSGSYIMPIPEMNIMNGAKHAGWSTDIQEYMIFPIRADSFRESVRKNAEIYQNLKNIIHEKGYATTIGDEGGFAPHVSSNEEPFELISQAIEKANYKIGEDICFGIDVASSEFYNDEKYHLKKEGRNLSSGELSDFYTSLINKYHIISIEDPFSQDDWESFKKFTELFGNKIQIVGDDLFVTNVKRLQKGIDEKSANAILIKLNQIGTLTETVDAILLARRNNLRAIVSHRSGETEDTFIADLAVAMNVGQIKSGAPARSERVAKYNRLMVIEKMISDKSSYFNFPINF